MSRFVEVTIDTRQIWVMLSVVIDETLLKVPPMLKLYNLTGAAALILAATMAPAALGATDPELTSPEVISDADEATIDNTTAEAAATSGSTTEDAAPADEKSEKIVCKTSRVVNSRIPQRTCMTQWQWDERQRAAIENREQNRNRNSSCGASVRC